LKPVECPTGDGIQTRSPGWTPTSAKVVRTARFAFSSVCMMAFGVASVPEVKMSSETAEGVCGSGRSGSAPVNTSSSVTSPAVPAVCTMVSGWTPDARRASSIIAG
jgi:hypothetical protein